MNVRCFFRWVFFVVLAGLLLFLGAYNFSNNDSFFEASLVNIITIGIAVGVSYWLTQKQTDRRKQKDLVVSLVLKIQLQISEESMYCLGDKPKEEITLRNRNINNQLNILQTLAAKKFSIEKEIKFVMDSFSEYETFVGDHIDNPDYLAQSKKELQRPLGLMDSKLSEIAIKLYS